MKVLYFFYILSFFSLETLSATPQKEYKAYHLKVLQAEQYIASENYTEALLVYDQLCTIYDFVFLREYQIATQLAAYTEDKTKTLAYLKAAIQAGWTLKSIKKNTLLKQYLTKEDWKAIKKQYPSLRIRYENSLETSVRQQVKKMYSKDQWKAIKALFRFSSKAQDRYAEKKFAPHSEQQIAQLSEILSRYGYPGERLIGTGDWMATILSHHNSISTAYNKKDTLYPSLIPQFKEAIKNGQLSPYQFASIDDWYRTCINDPSKATYGILNTPSPENRSKTDVLRAQIHIRSIAVRDALLRIEEKTGMVLYITDIW
ncbi:hypothetical protein ACFO3O_11295 [Dokdonia ponticola]|uniref:Tetratricopeptide repeat protein n=1 Tax=Dokdonia ponticola TaxID=2041041 RepID=A0ABV9HWF2_9FLAO